jgi:hypothetical protein
MQNMVFKRMIPRYATSARGSGRRYAPLDTIWLQLQRLAEVHRHPRVGHNEKCIRAIPSYAFQRDPVPARRYHSMHIAVPECCPNRDRTEKARIFRRR